MIIRLLLLLTLCTTSLSAYTEDMFFMQENVSKPTTNQNQANELKKTAQNPVVPKNSNNLKILDTQKISPKKPLKKNHIIVTMEKFLLGIESSKVTDQLGYINLARCIGWRKAGSLLIPGITGASQQQEFFNLLAKIQFPKLKKTQSIEYRGKEIPEILYHCWLGTTNNKTLLEQYRAHIKTDTELSDVEKETLHEGAALATTEYHTILKKIDGSINLVKELKKNDENKLYLILNGNEEILAALKKEHADVFDLFDEVVSSHEAQAINTQKEIYQYVMKKFQFDTKRTYALTSFNTNKKAAQLIPGLSIINAKKQNFGYVQEQLEKFGLIKK